MSKLPEEYQFIDVSDYGRPIARRIANSLKDTKFTPIDVTIGFIISGLLGVLCILLGNYWAASFFLLLKSILDAADGELARIKDTPSYIGRYLDSVADIILNFLILLAIAVITDTHLLLALLAFIGVQLQGTLYNYYYVILRTKYDGDTTSRIIENEAPLALNGENQKHVNILFNLFKFFYSGFDKVIYLMDKSASTTKKIPKTVMTMVSTFGLGFQLLLISIFLITGFSDKIIIFFIFYTLMLFVFIGIRRSIRL
jgi:phosphatidylserine synthase